MCEAKSRATCKAAVVCQTGKYVVRAEDLQRASTLPCAQRPTKREKVGKYSGKIYNYVSEGVAG